MSLSKLHVLVMNRDEWHAAVHGLTMSQTQLIDWTEQKPQWKQYTNQDYYWEVLFINLLREIYYVSCICLKILQLHRVLGFQNFGSLTLYASTMIY